jgi:class 3 adenylate cyclase
MSEHHYCWEWRLRSSPERLWPLVADTNRFNRDAGVPELELGEVRRGGRRLLRLRKLGIPIEWEEEPFEWIEPHRFSVVRRYSKGPLSEMRVAVELVADGPGTLLTYEVWAIPRNVLGRIALPVEIGRRSRARFERAFHDYDERLAAESPRETQAQLAPGGGRRLATGRETLLAEGLPQELVDRFAGVLERADDFTVARLRPYALADAWGAERRGVLELFLHATRAGLVEFRWDLLCPLCRGPQQRAETLREIEPHQHCDSCAIDFRIEFERSVELTFRPARAIREVVEREFCVGGPQVTPHIVVQQLVEPGGERTLEPELPPGGYRLRTREAKSEELFVVAPGERPTVRLENSSEHEELFVLERTTWSDQAVCAAEVTALQVFRDLFAHEALRPNEPISVGTLTVLFTDLRDSTRFYLEIGDAPAFGSVMDHLDVLRAAVADEGGAVVKAMGDAIMAVFPRPVEAVRAAQRAQRELAVEANGRRPFLLKVGIHTGPCIAVTQNERLDYFGSTVNLAARLVDLSSGTNVVVSTAVTADPEVADLLGSGLNATPVEATLKGFEDERFEIWSVD